MKSFEKKNKHIALYSITIITTPALFAALNSEKKLKSKHTPTLQLVHLLFAFDMHEFPGLIDCWPHNIDAHANTSYPFRYRVARSSARPVFGFMFVCRSHSPPRYGLQIKVIIFSTNKSNVIIGMKHGRRVTNRKPKIHIEFNSRSRMHGISNICAKMGMRVCVCACIYVCMCVMCVTATAY